MIHVNQQLITKLQKACTNNICVKTFLLKIIKINDKLKYILTIINHFNRIILNLHVALKEHCLNSCGNKIVKY